MGILCDFEGFMFQPCSSHWSRGHWSKTWTTPCRLSVRNQIHTIYGTTNHPKSSKNIQTLRFFGVKFWGVCFVVASHSPPFFWGKNQPNQRWNVPPGTFHPVGNPNQTHGVENESRISTRSGAATPRMESPNLSTSFWCEKKTMQESMTRGG